MKIGLVCPYDMFGKTGGVAQIVVYFKDNLTARGHEVKIITPKPSKYKGETPEGYIFLGDSRKIKAGLATAGDVGIEVDGKEIEQVLDKEKFDVIHFNEPWIPHLSRQIIQRSNAAHVGTFHASLLDSLAGKSILNMTSFYWKGIFEKTHVATAVSDAAAAGLLEYASNVPIVKELKYIPNGTDLKKFKKTKSLPPLNKSMKTILYVGRLEGRKGVKYLLRAYDDLASRRDDVQLYLAGKGLDEASLRKYVKDYKIPRVTFLGFVNEEEKVNYLQRADLFCAPAHRGESFGLVLLEAMAAACPLVAGDNVGYLSVMKGTGAISLVNPLDTSDFSRRLELMLFDDKLRKVWKDWAADYVKQFDWEPIIDQYLAAYKEAIAIKKLSNRKKVKNARVKKLISRIGVRRQS